ncbi:MAG: WHG domain-containing protein [Tetrasphaera sp.]
MTSSMTSESGLGGPMGGGLTRRERQRLATYDEIVVVSRALLARGEEVSLRAVAGEMGMTPPALYRYVDGHAELLALLGRAIFVDVVEHMAAARDRFPATDPAGQIVAAAVAFRSWALREPAEFRLVFASAESVADGEETTCCPTIPGVTTSLEGHESFGVFFAEIFTRLWQQVHFPVPGAEQLASELGANVVAALAAPPAEKVEVVGALPTVGPGMLWIFQRAWVRLYGTVILEVFGHIHPALADSGALFAATVRDIGRDLGLEADWERLGPILRELLAHDTGAEAGGAARED